MRKRLLRKRQSMRKAKSRRNSRILRNSLRPENLQNLLRRNVFFRTRKKVHLSDKTGPHLPKIQSRKFGNLRNLQIRLYSVKRPNLMHKKAFFSQLHDIRQHIMRRMRRKFFFQSKLLFRVFEENFTKY